jgi:hypothetical protein
MAETHRTDRGARGDTTAPKTKTPDYSKNRPLLTAREVAPILNTSVASLRRWRTRGLGPPFLRLRKETGSGIRYDADQLAGWIASRPSGGEGGELVS